MKKLSIIIPVYYNENNLKPLYQDLKDKLISDTDIEFEIIMVDDGSGDQSWSVIKELALQDKRIKAIHLSRNFGSHSAILCGLSACTGDCAVIKAADLQEPTEIIREMYQSWLSGNNVVLACRSGRNESQSVKFFANSYYWMVRKFILPQMPPGGFDIFLIDRKVIEVLERMDEKDSAITGQILWSGFRTGIVYYTRQARTIGKSRWTFKKKIRLVSNTMYSFSSLPITIVTIVGTISVLTAIIWGIIALIAKLAGKIPVTGWTSSFIFQIFGFGMIMITLGIIGGYLWRIFDAARKRPTYIIEDQFNSDTPQSETMKKEE